MRNNIGRQIGIMLIRSTVCITRVPRHLLAPMPPPQTRNIAPPLIIFLSQSTIIWRSMIVRLQLLRDGPVDGHTSRAPRRRRAAATFIRCHSAPSPPPDHPDNKRTSTPRLIVRRCSHHHRGDTRGPLPPAPPQQHCAARRRRETT